MFLLAHLTVTTPPRGLVRIGARTGGTGAKEREGRSPKAISPPHLVSPKGKGVVGNNRKYGKKIENIPVFSFFLLRLRLGRRPSLHRVVLSICRPTEINLLVYNLPSSTHKMARARSGSFSEQMMDMEEVLVSEGAIEARVRQLAEQINKEYKGKSIVVIGILKGSVMFMTDLVKRLHVDAKIEFMVRFPPPGFHFKFRFRFLPSSHASKRHVHPRMTLSSSTIHLACTCSPRPPESKLVFRRLNLALSNGALLTHSLLPMIVFIYAGGLVVWLVHRLLRCRQDRDGHQDLHRGPARCRTKLLFLSSLVSVCVTLLVTWFDLSWLQASWH
jgi:hypothetical protein